MADVAVALPPLSVVTSVSPVTGPATSAAPASSTGPPQSATSPQRSGLHHRHHHSITHSQFTRQDKGDANLPVHVKAHIIEESPKRKPVYEPDKVYIRNEIKYTSRDHKSVAMEKARRMQEVLRSGFFADPRDTYKSLGPPTIDSEQLIFDTLHLDHNVLKKNVQSKTNEGNAKVRDVGGGPSGLISPKATLAISSNGYDTLKATLRASRARLFAVKFGIPFSVVCPMPETETSQQTADSQEETVKAEEPMIDYKNLAFDPDRMNFYESLYERPPSQGQSGAGAEDHTIHMMLPPSFSTRQQQLQQQQQHLQSAPRSRAISMVGGAVDPMQQIRSKRGTFTRSSMAPTSPAMPRASNAGSGVPASLAGRRPSLFAYGGANDFGGAELQRSSSIDSKRRPLSAGSANKLRLTPQMAGQDIKGLEEQLTIYRPATADPVHQLLTAQQDFYTQQEQLNEELSDELEKLDAERPITFQRKYHAFKVGAATIYVDDIANMRRRVRQLKLADRHRLTREHPWFEEMVRSVFYCNGTKTELTPMEQRLLKKIREHIEEKLEWNQAVLISLLRMVSQVEFPDLQKIFRFIKTAEAMGEREYLEAIELSGHTV